MKVILFLWSMYYFLACNCKTRVLKSWNEDMLSSYNAVVSSNDKHPSFVLCELNTTCFNNTDGINAQNDRRESNILKIRNFEYNLDGLHIETLEVGTFESHIDIEMMSKVLSLFVQGKTNSNTVKFCPESGNETQGCIEEETPRMVYIDDESAVNILETYTLYSEDQNKYSCIKNTFTNDIQNLFTIALAKYDDCIALKSTKCIMLIALPCEGGVNCSKVVVVYNVHPCDVEIDAESSQGQGRTEAWYYVIGALMLVFVFIKAVAKTGATVLWRLRRVQLLPVSNVFGRAPNASTPLVINGRPQHYSALNIPRCSSYRTCKQFDL